MKSLFMRAPLLGTFMNSNLTSKDTIVNLVEYKFRIILAKAREFFTVCILLDRKLGKKIEYYYKD